MTRETAVDPNEPYRGTRSIRRALGLLRHFTDAAPEKTLSELAAEAGLHHTTTYRCLTALVSESLVERTPHATYRLGPGLITLGFRAVRANDLPSLAREELRRLAEASGETTTLEIPVSGEMLILDEVPGPGLVGIRIEIGTRWPLHATSTGKALLAAAGPDAAGVADSPLRLPLRLPAHGPGTITTRKALSRELERIRADGYAVAREELQAGYMAVGAAILNHEGRPVAAVGIGGPSSRLETRMLRELGESVRAAALRVSERLGAPASAKPDDRKADAGADGGSGDSGQRAAAPDRVRQRKQIAGRE